MYSQLWERSLPIPRVDKIATLQLAICGYDLINTHPSVSCPHSCVPHAPAVSHLGHSLKMQIPGLQASAAGMQVPGIEASRSEFHEPYCGSQGYDS